MKIKLTEADIKELKYQTRAGKIVSSMIFILGACIALVSSTINETYFLGKSADLIIILLLIMILSISILYLMTWKYLSDIENKEKLLEFKVISKKEFEYTYEAGSGSLYIGQKMKQFDAYSLVIDYYRYNIEKTLFDKCNEGDDVVLFMAPKSKHLLGIELKKDVDFII